MSSREHLPVSRPDVRIALALSLVLLACYGVARQVTMYGDGPGLVTMYALGTGQAYYNIAYLPVCRILRLVFHPEDPVSLPLFLSVSAAALGSGLLFLFLRRLGASRGGALFGALLVALSPLLVFFATTVEIHALQFFVVTLCACVTAFAPWRRRALALSLVALAFPLLYWAHITSVLLGPGWVLLVGVCAQRAGRPFTLRGLLFGVGPLLFAALVFAMAVTNRVNAGTWSPLEVGRFTGQIEENLRPPRAAAFLREGVWLPHFLLLPLAAWALVRRRLDRWELACALLFVLPSFFFYWWWGVIERGAYFVATLPVLGWLAARAVERSSGPGGSRRAHLAPVVALTLSALVAWQAARAFAAQAEYDNGYDPAARAQLVREALGGNGLLVSATDLAPDIAAYDANLRQISLWDQIAVAFRAHHDPAAVVPAVRELDAFVAAGPVVFDLSYRAPTDRVIAELRRPYFEAIEAELKRRFETREIADPYWPLLELKLRN